MREIIVVEGWGDVFGWGDSKGSILLQWGTYFIILESMS